jgi:hypothetical protein
MDKTPNVVPIENAANLLTFHSNAKFIHCSRRHVDNIQSKIAKFPQQSFQNHCIEWAKCSSVWQHVKPNLGESFVDFDYHALVTDVKGTVQKIGTLLGLNGAEMENMVEYLQHQRPQAAPDRDLVKHLKFSEVNWSDEERELFTKICVPVGNSLGYGLESYFQ